MITLTTPAQINSVLGGNVPVNYDKLVLSPFNMEPTSNLITGSLRLTSTTSPTMQAITGQLRISGSTLDVQVEQLDFYRKVTLTGPQTTSVQNIIANAQNALEAGLVSLGVIAGTQSAGA